MSMNLNPTIKTKEHCLLCQVTNGHDFNSLPCSNGFQNHLLIN